MYFCNTEVVSVNRKSIENNQDMIRIEGYDEILSISRFKPMDAMFATFYKLLKDNNRIINGSYGFFNQDLESMKSKLLNDNGIRPDRLIYSSELCYNKIWNGKEPNKFYEHKVLLNADSSNEFVVCTYALLCMVGTVISYHQKRDEWVLKEPRYLDSRYKNSHYNYYYGVKFS